MLPSSLFSASTLKPTGQSTSGSKNHESDSPRKRSFNNFINMSSSESSSDSDSDYEIKSSYTPNELQHDMDIFTKKLEHQFLKQKIYMEKSKMAARSIRDLNKKLAKLSKIAMDPAMNLARTTASSTTTTTTRNNATESDTKIKDKGKKKVENDISVVAGEEDDMNSQPLFGPPKEKVTLPSKKNKKVNDNNDNNNSNSNNNNNNKRGKEKQIEDDEELDELGEEYLLPSKRSKQNNTIPKTSLVEENSTHHNQQQQKSNASTSKNTNTSLASASASASSVESSAATPGLKKKWQNKTIHDRIQLRHSNYCDIFHRKSEIVDRKSLNRKPRSLLSNRSPLVTNQDMRDLLIATSLDGQLQFINMETKKVIKTLESDILFKDAWVEDICWASPNSLALSPAVKNLKPNDHTITMINIKSIDKENIEGQIQKLPSNPHSKAYTTITSCDTGKSNYRASFLTAGEDKAVFFWDLSIRPNEEWKVEKINRAYINHTNRINTLLYDVYSDKVFSGASDKKMICYDLQAESQVFEHHFSSRVNNIMQSKATPNLFLISESKTTNQFTIYDQRCINMKDSLKLNFGCTQDLNLSRYITPDWHENGYTVVCGSQTDSKINFWDLRYNKVSDGPTFAIPLDGTKRILPTMFIPNRNTIVAASSGHVLSWVDYAVQRHVKI
ncbi:unnamed protein product [Cunninghamella echinulata]